MKDEEEEEEKITSPETFSKTSVKVGHEYHPGRCSSWGSCSPLIIQRLSSMRTLSIRWYSCTKPAICTIDTKGKERQLFKSQNLLVRWNLRKRKSFSSEREEREKKKVFAFCCREKIQQLNKNHHRHHYHQQHHQQYTCGLFVSLFICFLLLWSFSKQINSFFVFLFVCLFLTQLTQNAEKKLINLYHHIKIINNHEFLNR